MRWTSDWVFPALGQFCHIYAARAELQTTLVHEQMKQHIKRIMPAWTTISTSALPLMCSCMCCSDASHPSMSSGLSPRDMRPRVKPWDLEEGFRVRECDLCC